MNRTALAAAALVLSAASTAAAQQPQARSAAAATSASTTSIGPVVGLNYTTFTGSDAGGSDYHLGVMVGGQLDHTLGTNGMLRTGLAYSRRGAEASDQGVTAKVLFSYLEVPLMLGYRFGTAGGARAYLMGGGHVGLKVGCKLEASSGGASASESCSDAGLDASSSDAAVGATAGIVFPATRSDFDVHVGYSYGLVKVIKDADLKNSGFTLAVAYMIPLGTRR